MNLKILNKKHLESLKNKVTTEYKDYLEKIKDMPNDEIVLFAKEITKKNQIYEYLINSLQYYDSEEIRALLSHPNLLSTLYEHCTKENYFGDVVSIPVEDAIDEITFDYMENLRLEKNRKPTWFEKVTGLDKIYDDEDWFDEEYYYVKAKDYRDNHCKSKKASSIDRFIKEIDTTPLEDAISYIMAFKKNENKQNHDFNAKMNLLLPKLKKIQLQEKMNKEDKEREERSR